MNRNTAQVSAFLGLPFCADSVEEGPVWGGRGRRCMQASESGVTAVGYLHGAHHAVQWKDTVLGCSDSS